MQLEKMMLLSLTIVQHNIVYTLLWRLTMSINISQITTCDLLCPTLVSDDIHSMLTSFAEHVWKISQNCSLHPSSDTQWPNTGPTLADTGLTLARHWPTLAWHWLNTGWRWLDTGRHAWKCSLCKYIDKIVWETSSKCRKPRWWN